MRDRTTRATRDAAWGHYAREVLELHVGELDQLSYFADSATFGVLVNDVFWWGTGDVEEVPPTALNELVDAFAVVVDWSRGASATELREVDVIAVADALYAARRRGLRPQGAYYSFVPRALRPTFDACGAPRDVDVTNPCEPGAYQRGALDLTGDDEGP